MSIVHNIPTNTNTLARRQALPMAVPKKGMTCIRKKIILYLDPISPMTAI